MKEEKVKSFFSEGEIENLCGIAYIKAKHNAYFDNGFRAGIDVACGKIQPEIEQLKAENKELLDALKDFIHAIDSDKVILASEYEQAKQLIEKHGK